MNNADHDLLRTTKHWWLGLLIAWTLLSALGLFRDIKQEKSEANQSARLEVRAHFNNALLYRHWSALHGGVYVTIDKYTQPNQYLEGLVAERDITTPLGKKLTLINPAYMTRQVFELAQRTNNVHSHLTSLNPLNPQNAADAWERSALQAFERGIQEVSERNNINGIAYMRLMQPLYVKQSCLHCHAQQGYKLGDIRGGISITSPMAAHLAMAQEHQDQLLFTHTILWLIGTIGIIFGMLVFLKRVRKNIDLQQQLLERSSALEQAGEAILITNARGRIQYVNQAFTQLTSYTQDEVINRRPIFLRAKNTDKELMRQMWWTILAGKVWQAEIKIACKNGKVLQMLTSIAPVYHQNDRHKNKACNFVGIFRDITREQDLEYRLRHMQKMESLGVLVGGIAHDFNNMLAGILGHMYLAKVHLDANSDSASAIQKAEELGFRASSMVSQLLTFARRDKVQMQILDIASFLKEALKLARVSVSEDILLESHIALTTPAYIYGDPTQLQQVLMNLLNNARDALQNCDNPRIDVKLDIRIPDAEFIKAYRLSAEHFVCLEVKDNGCGIDKKHKEDVFEPFYTSKPKGKGTGLGLAMVYGAIRAHGGVIALNSKIDNGTTFSIYLPLHEGDSMPVVTKEAKEIATGKHEFILLVDDDAQLRDSLRALLENFDYRVLEAKNGKQALEVYTKYKNNISVVMLDLIMPKMGGIDAAIALRQITPNLPLLFMSGYDRQESLQQAAAFDDALLLTKPFNIAQLSHHLRQLIEK
ncbi:MAG: DUF3365 domain-containing protein [Mariprofundales bacterium]